MEKWLLLTSKFKRPGQPRLAIRCINTIAICLPLLDISKVPVLQFWCHIKRKYSMTQWKSDCCIMSRQDNCQRIFVPPNRSSNVINIVIISIPVGTNIYTIYSVRNIYCNIYSCGNNIPEYFFLLEIGTNLMKELLFRDTTTITETYWYDGWVLNHLDAANLIWLHFVFLK